MWRLTQIPVWFSEPKVIKRFHKHVAKSSEPDGCWLWQGPIHPDTGLGVFDGGLMHGEQYAHRDAWVIANGYPVPLGQRVERGCGNRLCVRPDHLYLKRGSEHVLERWTDTTIEALEAANARAERRAMRQQRLQARKSARVRAVDAPDHEPSPLPRYRTERGLTEVEVVELLHDVLAGMSQRQAGKKHSLSQSFVSKLVSGHAWKHVARPERCSRHQQVDCPSPACV